MIILIFERCCIFLQSSSIMGKIQHSVNTPYSVNAPWGKVYYPLFQRVSACGEAVRRGAVPMWENFYGWGVPLNGFISGNAADRDKRKALLEYMIVSSPQHSEKTAFFSSFPHWRTSWLRHFVGYFIGISRKKASPIFYGIPSVKAFAGGGGSANRAGGFGGRGECTPFPKDSPPSFG